MTNMRKAQGAMEYLMTYGWAILVVMVVGIVMWQLGIFNLGGSVATTSSGFGAIKPQLASTAMGTDASFQSIFTNGAGTSIIVGDILLNDSSVPGGCTTLLPVSGDTIGAGDNFLITGDTCLTTGSIGSPTVFVIQIPYDISIGGQTVTKSSSGTIRGAYE